MCCKCPSVICDREHALHVLSPARFSLTGAPRADSLLPLLLLDRNHGGETQGWQRQRPAINVLPEKDVEEFPREDQTVLSPKLGSERRSGDAKKESGLWMFKRKKKQVLDRVFSSSQPNLCCSTPPSFVGDRTLCEQPDSSAGKGLGISPLAAADGASVSKPEISVSAHGSPKLLVSHLVMSQQKSSSLGSTCFEKLVVDSAASSEDELAKNASDLVSVVLKHKINRKVTWACFLHPEKKKFHASLSPH